MAQSDNKKSMDENDELQGYPVYAPSEDIYNKEKKDTHINSDDNTEIIVDKPLSDWNEEDYDTALTGDDLDVPGSEADDKEEAIGSEDEENNYYSLGGDNHADLDESHGE